MDFFKVVVYQTLKIVNIFGNSRDLLKTRHIFHFRTTANIRNFINLLQNVQNYFLVSLAHFKHLANAISSQYQFKKPHEYVAFN